MSRRWSLALAVLVAGSLRTPSAIASASCSPDVDGNQVVDFGDVAVALLDFGPCDGCASDLDGSGVVDFGDAAVVLLEFGPCPGWYTVLEQSPDPTVVYDASLRSAIIATGLPWRVRDNGTGIEMVLIPPATFSMGCSASGSYSCISDETVHKVTLTQAFYLSRTEVTQAQWVAKMGSNPSAFWGESSHPVEQVSWNDVQPFCTNNGLRLPTEAEWEYAYRAGTTTAFHGWATNPNGTNYDNQLGNIGWIASNSGSQTRPVGGKAPNGFGVFDMAGNVWEWVNDWYGGYGSSAQTNPTGPDSGSFRVLRGGSWYTISRYCRASSRSSTSPVSRIDLIGFRVARTP